MGTAHRKLILLRLSATEFMRLKKACKDSELNEILKQLEFKWRDDDSPAGEFSSSSSPE